MEFTNGVRGLFEVFTISGDGRPEPGSLAVSTHTEVEPIHVNVVPYSGAEGVADMPARTEVPTGRIADLPA